MKEVPVKGGQLRLVKGVTVTAPGNDGPRQVKQIAFPLKHTAYAVRVAGMMAHTTVTQTFANPFGKPIEAVYLFPLGDRAAVSGYEIIIGERVIKGKIKTRGEAQKIYRRAKAKGYTAGLLQQEKANVFSQRVANIAPGESVRVRFRYVELLQYRDQRYELALPLVVGPRYVPLQNRGKRPLGAHHAGSPAPTGMTSIPYVGSGVKGMPGVSITVEVDAGVPVAMPSSSSHAIAVKRLDATRVKVQLKNPRSVPNRDFVLRYSPKGAQTMVGLLTHAQGKKGFFVLVVQPKRKYRTGDVTPREVLLLLDVSGSMGGKPLAHSKAVARGIIHHLSARDTFNIMTFASGTRAWSRTPRRATPRGKAAGLQWLAQVSAGGGTELERAVVRSLKRRPGADRVRMVYVLTDGYVGNDKVILATARRHLGHNRIFPVGVGSAPNRFLLNRLAEVGRGFPSYISLRESPKKVTAELVRRTTQPYLTGVRVRWKGLAVKDLVPARIPDVYAGLPLVLAGRYTKPGKGTVVVAARRAGKKVAVRLAVTLPAKKHEPGVAHLWARQRIAELVSKNYDEIAAKTRKAITRLGLRFGLVTDYTSYVAVDRSRVVNAGGQVRTVVQPAPVPEGVNLQTAVQGAPPSPSGGSGGYVASASGGGGGYGGAGLGVSTWWLWLLLGLSWAPLIFLRIRRRRDRARSPRREGRGR